MIESDRSEELAIKAAKMSADPLDYIHWHRGQRKLISAVRNPIPQSLTIVEYLKPNGVGGTLCTMGCWSAIMFGTANPLFQGLPFGRNWPFLRRARLLSTKEALKDSGPVQEAILRVFPAGQYRQDRGAGTAYYSQGITSTGWQWDVMTYDQSVLQVAGANCGLIIFVEPPPADIFYESVTRLRGNGMVLVDMTQMDMAQFNQRLVDDGALILDGKKVGEVRVVYNDIEDVCRDHSDGHRAHSAIEADIASWPPEEREARRTGKPLRLSGRIYQAWSDANELEILPAYHAECWRRDLVRICSLIDPHDRKPWAMGWAAAFPNDDVIGFSEWPPFDFQERKSSPVSDLEDYRDLILETEAAIGKPIAARFMDPEFMATPGKGNARTLQQMLAAPCRSCLKSAGAQLGEDEKSEAYSRAHGRCRHILNYQGWLSYNGSIRDGHILVRQAIGNPAAGTRAKFMLMKKACPNWVKGMRGYAYHEEKNPIKALSERPQYVMKDFPDLTRGLYLKRFEKWPQRSPKGLNLVPAPTGGPGSSTPRS